MSVVLHGTLGRASLEKNFYSLFVRLVTFTRMSVRLIDFEEKETRHLFCFLFSDEASSFQTFFFFFCISICIPQQLPSTRARRDWPGGSLQAVNNNK